MASPGFPAGTEGETLLAGRKAVRAVIGFRSAARIRHRQATSPRWREAFPADRWRVERRRTPDQCTDSEVRIISRHGSVATSEPKAHCQANDSSAFFWIEFPMYEGAAQPMGISHFLGTSDYDRFALA
jgi:hypothetical protein